MPNSALIEDDTVVQFADANGNGTGQYLGSTPVPISGVVSVNGIISETLSGITYSVNVEQNANSANQDNPIIFFKNPSNSGKNVLITRFLIDVITKGGQSTVRIWSNPTVTINGTSVAINNNFLGGPSNVSSIVNAYSVPTVTYKGTRLRSISCGKDSNSFTLATDGSFIIAPNNAVLITAQPEANDRIVALTLSWKENPI